MDEYICLALLLQLVRRPALDKACCLRTLLMQGVLSQALQSWLRLFSCRASLSLCAMMHGCAKLGLATAVETVSQPDKVCPCHDGATEAQLHRSSANLI